MPLYVADRGTNYVARYASLLGSNLEAQRERAPCGALSCVRSMSVVTSRP